MKHEATVLALALVVVAGCLLSAGCPRQAEETAPLEPVVGPQPAEPPTPEPEADAPADEPGEEAPAAEADGTPDTGSPDVQTISHGQEVDIADYAVKGKTTIFDFYSDACPPCRVLGPEVEALAERREDIALVIVDINRPGTMAIDWGSPVARQYSLQSIPHLRVFGPDGKELARGDEAWPMVQDWLE